MRPRTAATALALLAAALPARAQLAHDTITAGGRLREYYLALPAAPDGRPAPLVVFLHGGGGNARGAAWRYGFDAWALAGGAIVVYPEGVNGHWADGRDHFHDADDVAFIRALLPRLAQRHRIDSARRFVAGHSNGGIMAFTLACRMPGAFAAVGTLGAALPVNDVARCANAKPVAVIAIHGTEDPLVPYDGGGARGLLLGADANAAFWAKIDGCAAAPDSTTLRSPSPDDPTFVRRIAYAHCASGRTVLLYAIVGGGHGWPGEKGPLPEAIVGPRSEALPASQLIWDFFAGK